MLNRLFHLLEDEELYGHEYHGRNITWIGDKGRVVRVPFDKSYPLWGNEFYPEKIKSFVKRLKQEQGSTRMPMPLVSPTKIDAQYVIEYLENPDDMYTYDPLGLSPQLTLGDSELDEFAANKEDWLQSNLYVRPADVFKFAKEGPSGDAEYDEEIAEALEAFNEMEARLQEAIRTESGSIGDICFQVRDGNHRRVAAAMIGEPFFYGLVTSNDMQQMPDWLPDILI